MMQFNNFKIEKIRNKKPLEIDTQIQTKIEENIKTKNFSSK